MTIFNLMFDCWSPDPGPVIQPDPPDSSSPLSNIGFIMPKGFKYIRINPSLIPILEQWETKDSKRGPKRKTRKQFSLKKEEMYSESSSSCSPGIVSPVVVEESSSPSFLRTSEMTGDTSSCTPNQLFGFLEEDFESAFNTCLEEDFLSF